MRRLCNDSPGIRMFARPRQREWRRARRLTGLLLLLSMCASLFPLPLPVRSPSGKDRSLPFPCQDRPCGCMSAAQCWRKCCCFTDQEKLAWARPTTSRRRHSSLRPPTGSELQETPPAARPAPRVPGLHPARPRRHAGPAVPTGPGKRNRPPHSPTTQHRTRVAMS